MRPNWVFWTADRALYPYNEQMVRTHAPIDQAGPAVVAFVDPRGRPRRMIIRLDHASHIPPYEQLRAQLAVMITAGLLEPATRLPTVRDMASVLSVSPGTIARAYRELAIDE